VIGNNHSLTRGYVQRHIPPGSGLGLDIAVLDIAQDFLLAHLEEVGVFDNLLVFKGGTALRKLFAGSQGRFSTDLDFAVTEPGADRAALAEMVADEARVTLGPFSFDPRLHRGRWQIQVRSPFANPAITIKLDIGPSAWLDPDVRAFVHYPAQAQYGFTLPMLPVVRLEEILSEKIARLARSATARDASDLVWVARTSPHSQFSASTVRQLAALKVWVDNHGLGPDWFPAISPSPLDPHRWLTPRDDWDDEQIGLLASPPPEITALEADLHTLYAWLADLTETEARFARADAGDRGLVIQAIKGLSRSRLKDAHIW